MSLDARARETTTGQIISPEECIGVMDAIRLYTARADVKGSIEPGKFADMVVLDRDVLSVPVDETKDVKVTATIVDGNIVYQRDQ